MGAILRLIAPELGLVRRVHEIHVAGLRLLALDRERVADSEAPVERALPLEPIIR